MIKIKKTYGVKVGPRTNKYTPQYWYSVHAKNGKTLVHSETFKTKAGCQNSIRALVTVMHNGKLKIIDETKQPKSSSFKS